MERIRKDENSQEPKVYREQLITTTDLEIFQNNLLLEMRKMMKELVGNPGKK